MTKECIDFYKREYTNSQGQKYPCGNQCVCCAVLCDKLDAKIDDFLKDKNAHVMSNGKAEKFVSFDNEKWRVRRVNESCRGYRYYKIYIDTRITDTTMSELIAPYMSFYTKEVNFF